MVKYGGAIDLSSMETVGADGNPLLPPQIVFIGKQAVPFEEVWQYTSDAMQVENTDYLIGEGEA